MNCEYTWTVRLPATAGADLLLPVCSDSQWDQRSVDGRKRAAPSIAEIRRRAQATVEQSRVLRAVATELLRYALYMQRRRALIRRTERAIH